MTILQSYTTQMVLLGTALLGLASGIAGTFAVLRKESLIGDGLSHAALPGVVIAFLLTGIKDIEVLIAGAALSSITAAWLITITVENSKIKFDGALATILSAFFGLGMVLLTIKTAPPPIHAQYLRGTRYFFFSIFMSIIYLIKFSP